MKEMIVILGAGESGTGAGLLALQKGYDVFVTDQGQIKTKYKDELIAHQISFEEGSHSMSRILTASLVIKSPGIPDNAPVVKEITDKGIPVIDEIEFAFPYLDGKVIAITGTNGKTTTTLLTHHLLESAGLSPILAGNVGQSLARQIAEGKRSAWYVLEVSSFQLDGMKTFRPDIGILLNITPDHLDRYDYQMENYVQSKFRLIAQMKPGDNFIFFEDNEFVAAEAGRRSLSMRKVTVSLRKEADVYYYGGEMIFKLDNAFSINPAETTLKGPHNIINMMCAIAAASLAGVHPDDIKAGLKTFKNAPHRLESIATIRGVEFVNDSKATNVDSVIYALGSYDQPLIWIAGGVDKGNDYNLIKDAVQKKVKALICLGKENAKLKKAFAGVVPLIEETTDVKMLVRMALQMGAAGDVVLLSPACASFDLFKNYEDRGNQFREAVLELKRVTDGEA